MVENGFVFSTVTSWFSATRNDSASVPIFPPINNTLSDYPRVCLSYCFQENYLFFKDFRESTAKNKGKIVKIEEEEGSNFDKVS